MGTMGTVDLTDKVSVVFGLQWRMIDAFESRHAQISAWRAEGFVRCASARSESDQQFGLTKDEANVDLRSKGRRSCSAAALIASAPRLRGQTVLVLLQGEDVVYAVGLQDGVIMLDEIVAYPEISLLRARFAKACNQHSRTFTVLGIKESAPELGQLNDAFEWRELLPSRVPRSAQIVPLKSSRAMRVVVALSVLAAAAAGLNTAYQWREEERARARRLQAERAADPARLYATAVEQFIARPDGSTPAAPALMMLRQALGSIPVRRATWQLRQVHCIAATAICTTEWYPDGTRLATFTAFIDARPPLPQNWSLEMGPQLNQLLLTIPVTLQHAPVEPLEHRPTYQDFLRTSGSHWQKYASLGFAVSLKEPELVEVVANTPRAIAEASPVALHAATWSVAGQPWWLVDAFQGMAGGVVLDSVTVNFSGQEAKFSAEGKIYVRKK